MTVASYDRGILFAFLAEYGEFEDGRLAVLNGLRVDAQEHQKLDRWATWDTVPLDRVDRLLMRHGLMTFELEEYGTAHHGDDGFRAANSLARL